MKTARTKRMTKAAAVEAIAAILAQLGGGADLGAIAHQAATAAKFNRALVRESKNWPAYNAERAEDGLHQLSWEQYIDFAREHGEWLDEWPTPPQPE